MRVAAQAAASIETPFCTRIVARSVRLVANRNAACERSATRCAAPAPGSQLWKRNSRPDLDTDARVFDPCTQAASAVRILASAAGEKAAKFSRTQMSPADS